MCEREESWVCVRRCVAREAAGVLGAGACGVAYLLRGLRREYVDIKHLPIRVKEPAQLLIAAARRHAAHKELVLRVRLAAVGRVDGGLGEADLQRVAQGREGALVVERVDRGLGRDEGGELDEAAALQGGEGGEWKKLRVSEEKRGVGVRGKAAKKRGSRGRAYLVHIRAAVAEDDDLDNLAVLVED